MSENSTKQGQYETPTDDSLDYIGMIGDLLTGKPCRRLSLVWPVTIGPTLAIVTMLVCWVPQG